MRRSLMMGIVALACTGMALPANAQSRGPMGSSMSAGRQFERESPAFERREEFLEHRRIFDRRLRAHVFFRDRPFNFGFVGFPYYPYYTPYADYPPALALEGGTANTPSPPAPTQVADLPPCRDTVEGVVVLRGMGCAHSKP